mmetsp:Transcript_21782/g.30519  ORF Transcript_21782/g.30519 Transcript_21782/m.30519 type:complete len:328 (-) Transcript_21782:202-1185(-)|eukprot:CAMPEP_0185280414 /NCGR_PEP_ID=MMETSP1359-20130426/66019_1 /TAXON_ID=552665 /ORGANISM="Bigelowiella longifila, Strain CCMP242" /LENGTH=327 /DNA_ID=CAMNT_0027875653 /DNA_START=58 /DNA_END=1041 /DNA_ORIENTATION=+
MSRSANDLAPVTVCLCLMLLGMSQGAQVTPAVLPLGMEVVETQNLETNGQIFMPSAEISKDSISFTNFLGQVGTRSDRRMQNNAESAADDPVTRIGYKKNTFLSGVHNVEFWAALGTSFSMIIATELGDKTFFIAAILAMKSSRWMVYLGAISALTFMTLLSVAIGFALPNLISKSYTHYAAVALFVVFGVKMMYEACEMYNKVPGKNQELEEAEQELDSEQGLVKSHLNQTGLFSSLIPTVVIQSFLLTFVAEWGDRSQISTIALASSNDPLGVALGGTLGHACCTGLAVVGGRLLSSTNSEQVILMFGGLLFIAFAVHELYLGPA